MFYGYFQVNNYLNSIIMNTIEEKIAEAKKNIEKLRRIMKYFKYIFIVLTIIAIAAIAYKNSKKDILEKQKEQAVLDYYQDVETLLDSLYIYENDSIFNTNVGNKYLESKHKFDSLIINNK